METQLKTARRMLTRLRWDCINADNPLLDAEDRAIKTAQVVDGLKALRAHINLMLAEVPPCN